MFLKAYWRRKYKVWFAFQSQTIPIPHSIFGIEAIYIIYMFIVTLGRLVEFQLWAVDWRVAGITSVVPVTAAEIPSSHALNHVLLCIAEQTTLNYGKVLLWFLTTAAHPTDADVVKLGSHLSLKFLNVFERFEPRCVNWWLQRHVSNRQSANEKHLL